MEDTGHWACLEGQNLVPALVHQCTQHSALHPSPTVSTTAALVALLCSPWFSLLSLRPDHAYDSKSHALTHNSGQARVSMPDAKGKQSRKPKPNKDGIKS